MYGQKTYLAPEQLEKLRKGEIGYAGQVGTNTTPEN